jgi:hypothetical protein
MMVQLPVSFNALKQDRQTQRGEGGIGAAYAFTGSSARAISSARLLFFEPPLNLSR